MQSDTFFSASRRKPFNFLIFLAACMALSVTLPAQAQSFSVIYSFNGPPDGLAPDSSLLLDGSGNIFGVTNGGGVSYEGTAFKLSSSGKETVLYSFRAGYGNSPDSVIQDADGTLYGTTIYGGSYGKGAVFKLDQKENETVLYSFRGAVKSFGFEPNVVVRDEQGNLYGTTRTGGQAGGCFGGGCGIVFKLDAGGKETVQYAFKGGTDGGYPSGTIVRDAAGNLYGETAYGGDLSCYPPYGCGTVFMLDPAGKETVLHRFTGTGGDGEHPWAGLVSDHEGNLYGATVEGGTGPNCTSAENGCGTVFRVDNTGKETILHSFTGSGADFPPIYAALTLDEKGNIYGTTPNGGSQNCGSGCGAVFMLNPAGKQTILHEFGGGTTGAAPGAGVTLDSTGNIYGTTGVGGDLNCNNGAGCGTVFKLTR
ncbi:MAG TPA: choice-of-anchor tandem repeat GloVer-containing protein [Terriglobales bacterium]|jgi:uncharacterized repeat protein (TIGR03803 family)|nr:choice-of-anchor tandem repeat GloVer-containing protein [Terriglobales bacterium]